MIWPFNKSIIFQQRSKNWKKTRELYLKIHPCCEVCGSCVKPEVHHIIPVHIDESKELDQENLITLCDKYCHFIFGHLMNWRSHNPDIINDAKMFSNKIKDRP